MFLRGTYLLSWWVDFILFHVMNGEKKLLLVFDTIIRFIFFSFAVSKLYDKERMLLALDPLLYYALYCIKSF